MQSSPPTPSAIFLRGQQLLSQGQFQSALDAFELGARQGDAFAAYEWGRALVSGLVEDKARIDGIEALERARQAGLPMASYLLASVSLGDVLLPWDASKAQSLLLESTAAEFAPAWRALALATWRFGDDSNRSLSIRALQWAAHLGDRASAWLLGLPELKTMAASQLQRPDVAAWKAMNLFEANAQPLITRHIDAIALQSADDVISLPECAFLHAMSAARWRPSQVSDPITGQTLPHPIRSSFEANYDFLNEDFSIRWIQRQMLEWVDLPLSHAESLVVLNYGPGQEYRPHRDYLPPSAFRSIAAGGPGQREQTVILYLQESIEGGDTRFPVFDVNIAPKRGRLIHFRNLDPSGRELPDSLHAGLPPTRGEKTIATLWMREGQMRAV